MTQSSEYSRDQEVFVKGERGIVVELSDRHDWIHVRFPDRTDHSAIGGWVDPKHITVRTALESLAAQIGR